MSSNDRTSNKPGSGKRTYGQNAKQGQKRPYSSGRSSSPQGGKSYTHSEYKGKGNGSQSRPYGRPAPRPASAVTRKPFPEHHEVPHTDGMPARIIALAVIRDVTENGAYASLSLNEKLKTSGLSHQDRRLATRLVYDTLDNLIYLDYVLGKFMARPDTDIKLRNILRLGACQILLEDRIPESAATNTSVELCRKIGLDELAGVCNGILRNLIRGKDTVELPKMEDDPVKSLSVRYSMPEWLVARLRQELGEETAEKVVSSAGANQKYTTLRPNLMMLDSSQFEALLDKKVWEHEKGVLPFSWHVKSMADIGLDNDFISGAFSIQGEGSMMAAMAVEPKRGMQILDCCAAPGGKTCLMAEMMQGTGRVQAWDIHPHRVELIAAAARRLKLENVRPIARDALVFRENLVETMDAVLLDAPCTGMGEVNEKPDIRYRVTEESLQEIITLQKNLLDTVAKYVKHGGTLVYSTCSLLPSENSMQVKRFLSDNPDFSLAPLPDSIPQEFRRYEDTGLQLMPYRDGMAGFYICRMVRK